jgi:carbonic anhydrase
VPCGVRNIVVCGHNDCRTHDRSLSARDELDEQCRILEHDAVIGALLRRYGIAVRSVWFEDDGSASSPRKIASDRRLFGEVQQNT